MTHNIVIDGKSARLSVDGERLRYQRENGESLDQTFSLTPAGRNRFSVLMGGRSYTVALLSDGEVSVNGRVFHIEVYDPRSRQGRKTAGVSEGRQAVAAPMPGRVIRVLVEMGQQVDAGQALIVVEAMKMQNEMKSPQAGRVTEVKAAPGATVAAGEILIVIE